MMWLKRKIRNWLHSEYDEAVPSISIGSNKVRASDEPEIDGLRFTVMKAQGGVILQSRTYDRRRDESNSSTYIITDEEPYAERIGQIVSMEILKL